jgi:nicotinate-nucleotide adenylyltransferase
MSGIALFGGTFNPIHCGHLQMIKEVDKLEFIDKILIMPDNIPPHKEVGFLAENAHRVQMCRLAVNFVKKAVIDESELQRGGKSYTYDTLCFLKEKYVNDDLYLVCGGDMVLTLDRWYKADELLKMCTFIVFNRSGIFCKEFSEKVLQLKSLGAKIIVIETDILSVSSSQIRDMLKKGQSTDGFLPKSVSEYINENGIYK